MEYTVRLYLKDTKEKQSSYSTQHRHRTAESAWQPAAQLTARPGQGTKYSQAGHCSPTFSCYSKKREKRKKKKRKKKKKKKNKKTTRYKLARFKRRGSYPQRALSLRVHAYTQQIIDTIVNNGEVFYNKHLCAYT